MTEEEARAWIVAEFGVSAEARLARFAEMVVAENTSQNLVAPSTVSSIWARHIADSAQLISVSERFNPAIASWIDVGTGAGFPGLVVAMLRDWPIVLVEPRRQRAKFLSAAIERFDLAHAVVEQTKVAAATASAEVISARAVATLGNIFSESRHCAVDNTVWILPKGRSAKDELEHARTLWHGVFHVEQSLTDPDSLIVIALKVSRRCK